MLDLIWDAGGTLFDVYPAKVSACQEALRSLGHEADGRWLLDLFRQTTAYALRTVANTYGLELEALTARFEVAYDAVGPEAQRPFPYVHEVCAYVCEEGGRNFIVTHRGRASLTSLLQVHGLAAYFKDWITSEDPFPRKPDPASLLALADRHGLMPGHCLAVGDRALDIVAAKRAGMLTCLFGGGNISPEADLVIGSYDQLLDWLRSLVSS